MGLLHKKEIVKKRIKRKHKCQGACTRCTVLFKLVDIMHDSNIPAGYWFLTMKQFKGAERLKNIHDQYVKNLESVYLQGKSICFSGNQGTGKTMTSICILKSAIKKGFSVYYTTAADILNDMTQYKNNHGLRNTLKTADFLVIDELDSRFFVSDSVKELFSAIYENIFRSRTHNNMPIIICTNETEGLSKVFGGMSVASILSLNNQYLTTYSIAGKDFRKEIL